MDLSNECFVGSSHPSVIFTQVVTIFVIVGGTESFSSRESCKVGQNRYSDVPFFLTLLCLEWIITSGSFSHWVRHVY